MKFLSEKEFGLYPNSNPNTPLLQLMPRSRSKIVRTDLTKQVRMVRKQDKQ